jgi:hypothetical protein
MLLQEPSEGLAAELAKENTDVVIARGKETDILKRIAKGEIVGTKYQRSIG